MFHYFNNDKQQIKHINVIIYFRQYKYKNKQQK